MPIGNNTKNLGEVLIRHRLTHFHRRLRARLRFCFLRVERCESLRCERKGIIRNKHNTWMFQLFYLFWSEAPHFGIFANITIICTIRILHRCQVSRHCATITRKHKTFGRYHHWLLRCASVIVSGDFTLHTLSVQISFVVSVVERVTLLVRGEPFWLLKAVARIVRRNGSTAFH